MIMTLHPSFRILFILVRILVLPRFLNGGKAVLPSSTNQVMKSEIVRTLASFGSALIKIAFQSCASAAMAVNHT